MRESDQFETTYKCLRLSLHTLLTRNEIQPDIQNWFMAANQCSHLEQHHRNICNPFLLGYRAEFRYMGTSDNIYVFALSVFAFKTPVYLCSD